MKRLSAKSQKAAAQTYAVVIQPDASGGFWASCPALTGCYSQGETIEETLKNIKEAIALSVEDEPHKTKRAAAHDASLHLVTI